MNDCPIYLTTGSTSIGSPSTPPNDSKPCGGCNCGYLQYEDLIPYLSDIKEKGKENEEDYNQFEFRLREQILQISRLFDMEAGVDPGYFSKAHYRTTDVFTTNGGKFIKIPEFVLGTLEVRNLDDVLIDSSFYRYEQGHLIYKPCTNHGYGCSNSCSFSRHTRPQAWPDKCYKVSAKWGKDCADEAVKMAIREYLIQSYRLQDPVKMLATGLPVQIQFQVPYSWQTYMKNFKQRNKFYSQWAIA